MIAVCVIDNFILGTTKSCEGCKLLVLVMLGVTY